MKRKTIITTSLLLIFLLLFFAGYHVGKNVDSSTISATEQVQSSESTKQETEADSQSNEKESSKSEQTAATSSKKSSSKSSSESTSSKSTSSKKSKALSVPSSTGKLRVKGTQLTDSKGNPVQLRGISTHGIAWYPDYINKSCFKQLHDKWNVNVIRLAMYTEEYGGYCSGGNQNQLKQLIDKGVSYAAAQDMYAIIDWHILSDGNPNRHIDEAKAFFKEMSKKYAKSNHVIYEICNEPNGGTSWKEIKSYAEKIISVIRSNDKDAVILVGTPNWSQFVDQAAANPITKYSNIMYTLHFYAATHTDSLRNTMTSAIKKGLPVFVSEYGICDASGNGAIDESQANKWIDTMDKYGVSYVAWNLSNKAETSAILRSDCNKTSGFKESDLSSSGKWLYRMLTGKKASTTSSKSVTTTKKTTTTKEKTTSAPKKETTTKAKATTAKLSCSIKLVNSWESGGQTFYQYNATVQNKTKKACSQWTVDIAFNEKFTITDSWNGNYSVNGKKLTISSKDYNGAISAGGSTDNIGFIIKGSSKLKVTSHS